MNFSNEPNVLREGLVDQLNGTSSRKERGILMVDLLEEYTQRFFGFVALHPDNLQHHHESAFWRMIVVASDHLDEEITTHAIDLPEAVKEDALKFVSMVRLLDQKLWKTSDHLYIEGLNSVLRSLREKTLGS